MDLLPVDLALARILAGIHPLPAERVAIEHASGRVLAEALTAGRSLPAFDASAMDGYALHSEDAAPGARLLVIGESTAGRGLARALGRGEAARIFTGAPIPAGADTVLAQEDARFDGPFLVIATSIPPSRSVRRKGSDFVEGDTVLPAGRPVGPRDLWLAAAANRAEIVARRAPRVAVLSIGDELVPAGSTPGPHQTIASNALGVLELARGAGAIGEDLGIAADEAGGIAGIAAAAASRNDVMVTIGGASVGDHDVTRPALAAAGMAADFWRIAMRPGKPLLHGRIGATSVLGFPGNPASSLVCAVVFLIPLVRMLQGLLPGPAHEPAVLGAAVGACDARTTYVRARLVESPRGRPEAHPLPNQDSSSVKTLADAGCLLVRPALAPAAKAGDSCEVIRLARA